MEKLKHPVLWVCVSIFVFIASAMFFLLDLAQGQIKDLVIIAMLLALASSASLIGMSLRGIREYLMKRKFSTIGSLISGAVLASSQYIGEESISVVFSLISFMFLIMFLAWLWPAKSNHDREMQDRHVEDL